MASANIIRVAVGGQGRSGYNIHTKQIKANPETFKVVAIADQLPERREDAQVELDAKVYGDWRPMLKEGGFDLFVNSLPSPLHVDATIEALNSGYHVLCEKPMARTVADFDRMVEAAGKNSKELFPFQNNRVQPFFDKIQEIVASGVIGPLIHIRSTWSGYRRRWDWQTMRKHYGGNLLNTGPHALDQALQLFGTDAKPKVTCSMDRANSFGDAEDHVKILLQARGRPTVDLEISSCSAFPQASCEIYGTRGGLRHDGEGLRWRYFKPQGQPRRALSEAPIQNAAGIPAYCSEELKWQERSWTPPGKKKPENQQYYDMLYKTLSAAVPLEITLEQVRQQVAVMEECHRQNPAARMPKAEW